MSLRLGDTNDPGLFIQSLAAPLANGVSDHIRVSSFLPFSPYPPPSGASHISHGPFPLTFPLSDCTYYPSSLSFFSPSHRFSLPFIFFPCPASSTYLSRSSRAPSHRPRLILLPLAPTVDTTRKSLDKNCNRQPRENKLESIRT